MQSNPPHSSTTLPPEPRDPGSIQVNPTIPAKRRVSMVQMCAALAASPPRTQPHTTGPHEATPLSSHTECSSGPSPTSPTSPTDLLPDMPSKPRNPAQYRRLQDDAVIRAKNLRINPPGFCFELDDPFRDAGMTDEEWMISQECFIVMSDADGAAAAAAGCPGEAGNPGETGADLLESIEPRTSGTTQDPSGLVCGVDTTAVCNVNALVPDRESSGESRKSEVQIDFGPDDMFVDFFPAEVVVADPNDRSHTPVPKDTPGVVDGDSPADHQAEPIARFHGAAGESKRAAERDDDGTPSKRGRTLEHGISTTRLLSTHETPESSATPTRVGSASGALPLIHHASGLAAVPHQRHFLNAHPADSSSGKRLGTHAIDERAEFAYAGGLAIEDEEQDEFVLVTAVSATSPDRRTRSLSLASTATLDDDEDWAAAQAESA